VSLLGRLEDLSLADIIQIVYLSRRTGRLELTTGDAHYTITFRNGLVVDAASDAMPGLKQWIANRGAPDPDNLTTDVLAAAVRERIIEAIAPLLTSRQGEFHFELGDESLAKLEYDPAALFKEGGLPPQRVLTSSEKPLRALEESIRAGKQLLRTAPERAEPENVLPFPDAAVADETLPLSTRRDSTSKFRVAGGLMEIESPEARMRNVVLLEREALLRVAAKRAFAKREITIAQFGAVDDVRRAVHDWFRLNAFFVTVLEVTEESTHLLREIKRKNPRLPVAMIDAETDLHRRHNLLRLGADFYLSKPAGTSESELSLFAEELILFAERAFDQWEVVTRAWGEDAGRRFYEEADREQADRSFDALKHFIDELSNPNDIRELGATILRLAGEYLDRAALFVVRDDAFEGITEGTAFRMPRTAPSVLRDVESTGEAHRGKIRKTPANEDLMQRLGGGLPTEVVALPIVHDGKTIGILYGDNAIHRAPIESLTGLEVFLSQAGYAFGNAVTASR
jgi:CheY-like chemotaxis protein